MLHAHNPHNSLVGEVVTAMANARRAELPQFFTITYDGSKLPAKGKARQSFLQKLQSWGTLYPNGGVTLDYGAYFPHGMTELKDHFDMSGIYTIVWQNGDEETNAAQGSEKRYYDKRKKSV